MTVTVFTARSAVGRPAKTWWELCEVGESSITYFSVLTLCRFSAPVRTGPGAHPDSCTMGTCYFTEVKSGRGVTLTPYPF